MSAIQYTPPPTASRFIQSERFYNFIIGPVGSGKTTGALMKILYHASRQAPSPQDGIRYTRFVVIRNTGPMLRDTTIKSFFEWFTPGVAGQWRATDKDFIFRFGDIRCEVLFRPLDTPDDVGRVLSLEVTGAVIDEFVEIPKDIVEALSGRCGRYPSVKNGGCTWAGMWGASNPGNEDNWWYDWLYKPWEDVVHEDGTIEPGEQAKARMLGYFEQPDGLSPQAENLDNLRGKQNYYRNLIVGKSDAWINQFVRVRWGFSLSGTPVWKMFNAGLHVAPSLRPLRHVPIVIGFDAGLTPAAIIGQMDSFGRALILAEAVSENMGARRFCREKLMPLLRSLGLTEYELLLAGDPAIKQRAQTDERTVAEILHEETQIPVVTARTNDLAARLDSVDSFLTALTEAGPAFVIDSGCKTLIRGLSGGYRYAINTRGVRAAKPDKNSFSHPCDALQYLCMQLRRSVVIAERRKRLVLPAQPRQNSYVW